jgi:hypothetical protein
MWRQHCQRLSRLGLHVGEVEVSVGRGWKGTAAHRGVRFRISRPGPGFEQARTKLQQLEQLRHRTAPDVLVAEDVRLRSGPDCLGTSSRIGYVKVQGAMAV